MERFDEVIVKLDSLGPFIWRVFRSEEISRRFSVREIVFMRESFLDGIRYKDTRDGWMESLLDLCEEMLEDCALERGMLPANYLKWYKGMRRKR